MSTTYRISLSDIAAVLIAASLCVGATTASAEPPKRWMSIFDFMRAYQGAVVQTDDDHQAAQESPKAKPAEPPRWGWGWHKPKPLCHHGHCQTQTDPGGAVNFPPYDVQP